MTRYEIALGKKPPVQIIDKCCGESIISKSTDEYIFMEYLKRRLSETLNIKYSELEAGFVPQTAENTFNE
jgi:hypothetical protein